MYVWYWRRLPGPLLVRVLLVALTLAAVVLLLFLVVFPRVEPRLPFQNVTVTPAGTAAPASAP